MARQPHDWDRLLAVPLENIDLTDEQKEEIAIWQKEHKAELESETPPLLPHTAYLSYAERISDDWKQDLEGMIRRAKLPKIDRESIKEEHSKTVEKIAEDLKKDLQSLKNKEELLVSDFEKLKAEKAAALKDVSERLSKDLEQVIEKLKLSEETAETEIKDLKEKSAELTASWEKGLSKFISSSYSEVTEDKPAEEAKKTEKPAAGAEKPEAKSAESQPPEVGEPPEPVEEPAENAASEFKDAKAEETPAEDTQPEDSEAEQSKPEVPQLVVTLPEKESFDGLMLNWQDDVSDYVDSTDPEKLAGDKYTEYRRYLFAYLADIDEDLRKYQHEIWRLHQMENSATASDLPYQQGRIAEKYKETSGMVAPWISDIESLELAYHEAVGKILGSPDEPVPVPPRTDKLSTIDTIVPYWHLIVGGGLILGLFSRLCGTGAAIFLAAVIATQPPWVAGAADTYYQVVELCGCLVLATIPTGRFAGLDFFVHSFFSRCCTKS